MGPSVLFVLVHFRVRGTGRCDVLKNSAQAAFTSRCLLPEFTERVMLSVKNDVPCTVTMAMSGLGKHSPGLHIVRTHEKAKNGTEVITVAPCHNRK